MPEATVYLPLPGQRRRERRKDFADIATTRLLEMGINDPATINRMGEEYERSGRLVFPETIEEVRREGGDAVYNPETRVSTLPDTTVTVKPAELGAPVRTFNERTGETRLLDGSTGNTKFLNIRPTDSYGVEKLTALISGDQQAILRAFPDGIPAELARYAVKEAKDPASLDAILAQRVQKGEISLEDAMAMKKRGTPSPSDTAKMLPANTVLAFNEGKNVARLLPDVELALRGNEGIFGPIEGRMGQVNPYDEQAQTVDARMRTASQAFGRFMEGGVLRKEDEEKYRKMFPQLSDTPQVAKNKLAIVRRMLLQKYEDDRQTLGNSGYDTSGFEQLQIPPSIFEEQAGSQTKTLGGKTYIKVNGEWYEQ